MKKVIQNKWNSGITMVLLILLLIAACKKDKVEMAAVEFKIASYYPNSGNAGTLVNITGEGFDSDIRNYAATISGKEAEVISATATALVIRMPEGGLSGPLVLKHASQVFELGNYTYQVLSVTGVSPSNGPAGSQIRITGAGFSSVVAPASVLVNGKEALVVSVNENLIVAEVPADAGFGPVVIKVDGKEAKGQNFTYQAINGIKPLTGGKNTRVTISGEGFEELAAGNLVDFNGKPATVVASTEAQLVVIAPEGVTTGPLSVNINGQKTTGPSFTVVAPPNIQVVSPLSGPKGAEMIISGALFSSILDENKVFINNVSVPVQSVTGNQIKLVIPGGTGSGTLRVVVNDQATEGPQFKDQTLGITSVSPDNGLTGISITINGSGFSNIASSNKVYFNGTLATVKTATEHTLTLDAPVGLTTGDLKIVVGGEEAIAPQPFRRAGMQTLAGGPNSDTFGRYMAGIAVDNSGNVYVTDRSNKVVKKITPGGTVSVLQSRGSDIQFDTPFGIVIDRQDNIYVSDITRNQIRKITPSGENTIFVSGFSPGLMALDNSGNLYVNINSAYAGMNRVNSAGGVSKVNGPFWPTAKAVVDVNGNLYYIDSGSSSNNAISRILPAGTNLGYWAGHSDAGYVDAIGDAARFNSIAGGLARYGTDKIVAGDRFNNALREIDIATRKVSTIAKFTQGYADGSLAAAKVSSMDDMAVDKEGNIYILDASNNAVRKVFLK